MVSILLVFGRYDIFYIELRIIIFGFCLCDGEKILYDRAVRCFFSMKYCLCLIFLFFLFSFLYFILIIS